MIRQRLSILIIPLTVMVLTHAARAQAPAALNDFEKQYFDKGLNAAKRQAWDEAWENFRQTLGSKPEYAPVYFNLGVVFEKVGAPLEAAACLQAYLALSPNAMNAAAVRQEIAALEKKRAAEIDKVFQHAMDTILTIDPNCRNRAYLALAKDYARAGQIGKAVDLVKLVKQDSDNPIDRVPDLRIPDPWFIYAATLLAGQLVGSDFWTVGFSSDLGAPQETQTLLGRLGKVFPTPSPIGNPNDPAGKKIDEVFKERSETTTALRKYIMKALSSSGDNVSNRGAGISAEAERQIHFADSLIGRSRDLKGGINRLSYDLQANIRAELDSESSGFMIERTWCGPEYAAAMQAGKVAAQFGAEVFLFSLLERGAAGATLAVEGPEVEEALWKSVQDARNPERFLGYLAWFPKGKYAELADLSAKKLDAEVKLAASAPPPIVSVNEALQKGKEAQNLGNLPEEMRWFRMAADQGSAEAQTKVGAMYEGGSGVPKDEVEALRWYRKAFDQGNADAARYIAEFYERGAGGLPKDQTEARRRFRTLVDRGDVQATYDLINSYLSTKEYSQAMTLLRKLADQGNALAQFNIGEMYEKGEGVQKDLGQAAYWYGRADKSGGHEYSWDWGSLAREALIRIGTRPPNSARPERK